MKQRFALIISLSVHILIVLIFILFTPVTEQSPEETKINIELVTKIEKKSVKEREVKGGNVDIQGGSNEITTTIIEPQSNNYVQTIIENTPDLLIQNTSVQFQCFSN